MYSSSRPIAGLLLCALIAACGGGGSSAGSGSGSYQIGGTVTGLLSGNSVALQETDNNETTSTTVNANGTFAFTAMVSGGSTYTVTVATQPAGQTCSVTNGSGAVFSTNPVVSVICVAKTYTVSASVSGLANVSGLVLQDNGGANLTVNTAGTYAFATQIASQAAYSVTILTQPAGHTCIVQHGSNTVGTANVTVSVVCPHYLLFAMGASVPEFYIDDTTGSLIAVSGSSCAGTSIALAPNGKSAYVITIGGTALSACAIDPVSGALSGITGGSYTLGAAAKAIAISPDGGLVFVASQGSVSAFNVNTSTGALTPAAVTTGTDADAAAIGIDPSGQFAYLVGNATTAYTINSATGALTAITNGSIADGGVAITIDPVGGFVYVPAPIDGIYAYTLDGTTGVLTAVSGSPFATLQFPQGMGLSPNGRFLYVPAQGVNSVPAYSVSSTTGALTQISGSPFAAGDMPEGIVLVPSGQFAYVASYSGIGIYSSDPTTGALALLETEVVTTTGDVAPLAIGSVQ